MAKLVEKNGRTYCVEDDGYEWEYISAPQPQDYRQLRAAAYPPMGDQLDAIWKLLQPDEGTEAFTVKQLILAVKAKYPKV